MYSSIDEIPWERWTPTDVATLLFVIRGGEILLIRKLRGLGKGKINAPGGRLEPGEAPRDAAVRETIEEVGVRPLEPRLRGELRFQFTDGYALHCHVFSADACEGEARTTDEAIPLWTPLKAIPYDEMWADDALWLPMMLSGRSPFSGRFVFDAERMVSHRIDAVDPATKLFDRLSALSVEVVTVEHPPVFTVEEAKAHRRDHDGVHVKNLFLRNKKGRQWLVTVPEELKTDLDALADTLGAGKLSFASPARLRAALGVEAGSVTPLAALNDREGAVTVVLHRSLLEAPRVCCHPLTNDRTTTLRGHDLVRFLEDVGHSPVVL